MNRNFIMHPQNFWISIWEHKEPTLYTSNYCMPLIIVYFLIYHGLFPHISKIAYSYFILNSCTSLQCNCVDRTYTEISPCPPAVFSLQRQNYAIHVFKKNYLKSHESLCLLVCDDSVVQLEGIWESDPTSIIVYSLLSSINRSILWRHLNRS